ncbi:hypothetical protein [Deinococcus hopiensis]|uniref:Uncharacterized protein n=1 Tax=Deinococcus hopiensis KR-140 TaxID=695939 RepID=A0A1W1VD88_9DEIO|nr:hypothetical protein [Deinococcus hopiensis]SMB91285.1 hypothetical protein SAMN00790413_01077 [Deinococcus hopiensis KR-140]
MKRLALLLSLTALPASAAPTSFAYRTFHSVGAGRGQEIDVSCVTSRPSASGRLYGLEWWAARGEATPSAFTGPNTRQTGVLLTGWEGQRSRGGPAD